MSDENDIVEYAVQTAHAARDNGWPKRQSELAAPAGSVRSYHCWNCGDELDKQSIKTEPDGTITGTCWRCHKDNVSALENDPVE